MSCAADVRRLKEFLKRRIHVEVKEPIPKDLQSLAKAIGPDHILQGEEILSLCGQRSFIEERNCDVPPVPDHDKPGSSDPVGEVSKDSGQCQYEKMTDMSLHMLKQEYDLIPDFTTSYSFSLQVTEASSSAPSPPNLIEVIREMASRTRPPHK